MRNISLLILFVFLTVSSGCRSNWWDEPPEMDGKVVAVGQARFVGNENMARSAAETNAMDVLAGFVKTQMQSLTETWGKQAGDDKVASRISNYFNDEKITRRLVDTTLRGARPVKYEKHEGNMYVLMVIDTKAFAEYWKEAGSKSFEEDEVLIKSQAMKEDYANRMDRVIQDYLQRVSKGLIAK